jgi:hypothetical protein
MPEPKDKVEEKAPESEGKDKPETNETTEFMKELDKVIDEEIKSTQEQEERLNQDKPADKKPVDEDKDTTEGEPDPEKEEDGTKPSDKDGEEPEPTIPDELLERAVRAGFSMKDASAFQDASVLQNVVERLEATTKEGEPADKGGGDDKKEDEDPLAKIPDLDPEEFDEKIVSAMKGMKEIVKAQLETISSLKGTISGLEDQVKKAGSNGSWVDAEVAKLGAEYEDVFGKGNLADISDAKHKGAREKLARHIKFVQDEAKAEKTKISDADAFIKALESAFADKVKNVRGAKKQKAASDRSQRTVNRPRDTSGRFGSDSDVQYGTEQEREDDAIKAVEALMEQS